MPLGIVYFSDFFILWFLDIKFLLNVLYFKHSFVLYLYPTLFANQIKNNKKKLIGCALKFQLWNSPIMCMTTSSGYNIENHIES